jgi:hypothetical protein
MAVYKHLTEENIAKALKRVFAKYPKAWISGDALVCLTMYRYFYLGDVWTFDKTYQTIRKVLRAQVKKGRIRSKRGSGYGPI